VCILQQIISIGKCFFRFRSRVLGIGRQFSGGKTTAVDGRFFRQYSIGDICFQDLIYQVDIRYQRIGIFAG
jgi:hypothetical protein